MFLKNDGFSLVAALIAVGVVGIVALGVMRVTEQGYNASADLTARQELRDLRDEFYVSMRSTNCGIDFSTTNLTLNLNRPSPPPVVIDNLFNRHGQRFLPGAQYGKFKIHKTEPFILTPVSRNSPIIDGLPSDARTPGGYYILDDDQVVAELVIKLTKAGNQDNKIIPLKFIVNLTLNNADKVTGCKTAAAMSSARESCESMITNSGELVFKWDEELNRCHVTMITNNAPADGVYESTERGNVDITRYVLDSIP